MTKFSKFYITLLTLFVISCISSGARADYTALEAQCKQGFFPNCLTLLSKCSSWLDRSASPDDLQVCLADTNNDGSPNYQSGTAAQYYLEQQYNHEQECVQDGCTSGGCEAPRAACAPFFEQCEHWLRNSDQDIDYDLTACQLAQCMADGNNNGIPMYRDTADSTSKDTDGDGIVNECDPTQSSGGTSPGDAGGTNPDDAGNTDPGDAGGTNPDDAGGTPTPTDTDLDGKPDAQDNCPTARNSPQDDTDGDGIGDACDLCIHDANQNRDGSDCPTDTDLDGKPDAQDNCPATWNSPQDDTDGDGIGDACDICISDANQNRDGSDCPEGDNEDTSGSTAGNNSNQYTSPTDSARGGGNCSLAPGEIPLNALSYIPMLITLVLLRIKRRWK